VLPSATADDKNFHGLSYLSSLGSQVDVCAGAFL